MARKITISDGGGLSGFGSITVYEDTAEVMLEALADVLGVELRWDSFHEKRERAECGTVTVTALRTY
jgi:hypothetical protein